MSESNDIQGGDSTDRPLPPYDDRQKSGAVDSEGTHKAGANVGGATGPVEDSEMKATPKQDTPRGAEASPSDEQPASEMPEAELDDDRVGPAHTPGTGQGQDKSRDQR
jgi:hypothetical protein